MHRPSLATLATATLATSVQAWSTTVHNQIGFMAEEFLTPQTSHVLKQILAPQYKGSIGRAAAWPDSYSHTDEGEYTGQWHYIDSSDNPPLFCNVYYNRDCTKGGCVVSAIANFTVKLESCIDDVRKGKNHGGKHEECSRALIFVSHFLGDIAQPLHTSGVAAGGNGYKVTFGGEETNLHSVWDGSIIYALAKKHGFSNMSIDPFFHDLTTRIRKDTFFIPTSDWIECTDPSTPIKCALGWARDTAAWNCDYVFSQAFNGTDLATSGYAEGAYPIVELQVSKAALRLATWLNRLVEGRYKTDREVVLQTNPSWAAGPSGGK